MAVGVSDGVVVCVLVVLLVDVAVDVRVPVGVADGKGSGEAKEGEFGIFCNLGSSSRIGTHTVSESQHSSPSS